MRVLKSLIALRNRLVLHGETLAAYEAIVTLTAPPSEILARDEEMLRQALGNRDARLVPLDYAQGPAAAVTTPLGDLDRRGIVWWPMLVTPAARAGELTPIGFGQAGAPRGVYVGHTVRGGQPVFVPMVRDGRRAENWLIAGMTGAGKSVMRKALATGILADGGERIRVVSIDPDGEDRRMDVPEAQPARFLDLTSPSAPLPNLLALPPAEGDAEEDRGRYGRMREGALHAMTVAADLTPTEHGALERAVTHALAEGAGVVEHDPSTWDRPASVTWEDVCGALEANARKDRFADEAAAKVWRAVYGGLRHLFVGREPLTAPDARLTVLHTGSPEAAVDSHEAYVRFAMVTWLVWEWLRQNRRRGLETVVMVDEGQRVFQHPVLGPYFAALMTTIRKWRGQMIFATNTPSQLWARTAAGGGANPVGDMLWGNTPYKAIFALEEAQIEALARNAEIPPGVLAAIRAQREDDKTAVLRLGGNGSRCG